MKPARVSFDLARNDRVASNSLLCRLALKQTTIDAATFTLDQSFGSNYALAGDANRPPDKLAEGRQLAIRTHASLYICVAFRKLT